MAFVAVVIILLVFWLFIFLVDRVHITWGIVSEWSREILANLDSCTKYDFLGRPVQTPREKASREMDRLIKELHKIMYCVAVINNPPLTDHKIKERFKLLAKIENKNPGLLKWYSPTHIAGFSEEKAKAAFGSSEWLIVKNTLDLSVEPVASASGSTDNEFFQKIFD